MIWVGALNLVMNACCDGVVGCTCALPYMMLMMMKIIIIIKIFQGINFGAF